MEELADMEGSDFEEQEVMGKHFRWVGKQVMQNGGKIISFYY